MATVYADSSSLEKRRQVIDFKAYSEFYTYTNAYTSELSYPAAAIDVLTEMGAQVYDTANIASTMIINDVSGKTKKAIISEIALLSGCNAVPSNDGKIKFIQPTLTALTLTDDNVVE